MQAVQIELFPKNRKQQEQEEFLDILHHDTIKRGGMFSRLDLKVINEEEKIAKHKWSHKNPYSLMTTDDYYNRYIAINTFHHLPKEVEVFTGEGYETLIEKEVKRDQNHLHAISSIYIDLDYHKGTMNEIQERLHNSWEALNKAYNDGILPRPTMITETGRGMGIFYVLDKSIANSARTQKQIRFWEYICKEITGKYIKYITEQDLLQLEVDTKVTADKSRVTRLPGTKNLNSNTTCRLISVARTEHREPLYYTLGELAQYCENYKIYPDKSLAKIKKNLLRNKIVNINGYDKPYLFRRLEKLDRARECFKNEREGHREYLCFQYYNTAVQIMSREEAEQGMYDYHAGFTYPLECRGELENIIRSVDKAKDPDTGEHRGYYIFTDARIAEVLELTEEQNRYIGFGISNKQFQREQTKRENQKKRKERNEQIAQYTKEHPEETYASIAKKFGVGLRTIKTILQQENVRRYDIKDCETSVCAAQKSPEKSGTRNEKKANKGNLVSVDKRVKKQENNYTGVNIFPKGLNSAPNSIVVLPKEYNNIYLNLKIPESINIPEGRDRPGTKLRGYTACVIGGTSGWIRGGTVNEDGWSIGDCSWIFEDPD